MRNGTPVSRGDCRAGQIHRGAHREGLGLALPSLLAKSELGFEVDTAHTIAVLEGCHGAVRIRQHHERCRVDTISKGDGEGPGEKLYVDTSRCFGTN